MNEKQERERERQWVNDKDRDSVDKRNELIGVVCCCSINAAAAAVSA